MSWRNQPPPAAPIYASITLMVGSISSDAFARGGGGFRGGGGVYHGGGVAVRGPAGNVAGRSPSNVYGGAYRTYYGAGCCRCRSWCRSGLDLPILRTIPILLRDPL